jgi:hypothetical protein
MPQIIFLKLSFRQQLKRVVATEIEKFEKCGGPVRINASLEDSDVIKKILKHLGLDRPLGLCLRACAVSPHNWQG